MEIIFETQDARLKEILESPFFEELVVLLQAETPTLRRLKEVFGTKIEQRLELLIAKKIIQRTERRYFLALPIFRQSAPDEWVERILAHLKGKSQTEIVSLLVQLSAERPKEIVYGIEAGIPFSYYASVATTELEVASVSLAKWGPTLPSYFSYLRTAKKDVQYQKIQRLLGDVAVDYYLDQVLVIVEKILHQRRRIRDSIFLQSMREFGLVATDTLQLLIPVADEKPQLCADFAQLTDFERRAVIAQVMIELEQHTLTILYLKN